MILTLQEKWCYKSRCFAPCLLEFAALFSWGVGRKGRSFLSAPGQQRNWEYASGFLLLLPGIRNARPTKAFAGASSLLRVCSHPYPGTRRPWVPSGRDLTLSWRVDTAHLPATMLQLLGDGHQAKATCSCALKACQQRHTFAPVTVVVLEAVPASTRLSTGCRGAAVVQLPELCQHRCKPCVPRESCKGLILQHVR